MPVGESDSDGTSQPENRVNPIIVTQTQGCAGFRSPSFIPPSKKLLPIVITLTENEINQVNNYEEIVIDDIQVIEKDVDQNAVVHAVDPSPTGANIENVTRKESEKEIDPAKPEIPQRSQSLTDEGVPTARLPDRGARDKARMKMMLQSMPPPRKSSGTGNSRSRGKVSISLSDQSSDGEILEDINEEFLTMEIRTIAQGIPDHVDRRIQLCSNEGKQQDDQHNKDYVEYLLRKITKCEQISKEFVRFWSFKPRNYRTVENWNTTPMNLEEHRKCINRKEVALLKAFEEYLTDELRRFKEGSWWCNHKDKRADELSIRKIMNKILDERKNDINWFTHSYFSLRDVAECTEMEEISNYAMVCYKLQSRKRNSAIVAFIKAFHKNAAFRQALGSDYRPVMNELNRLLKEIHSGYHPPKGKHFRRLVLNVAQFFIFDIKHKMWRLREPDARSFYTGVPKRKRKTPDRNE